MKFATFLRLAPLPLRLILGIIFISHGIMKFTALASTVHSFGHIGIPLPTIAVPIIALIELIGGIALILGLGSRMFALLLALDMLVAILTVKLAMGLVGGYEFELSLIAGLLTLILSGPGTLAIIRDRDSLLA
ncbi:MAG TPA: DoxX family protein [Ktedonobacteraceae bacterium]|jgi:putative oxidoreductase